MNKDFPRILSLLRKERGISQKSAAGELGVTQALLSHYEKGKRECGLDFVVSVADFYNVSTDYLLGRTASTNGTIITAKELSYPKAPDTPEAKAADKTPFKLVLTKKLLTNGIDVLFTILYRTGVNRLTDGAMNLLILSFYRVFRLVHAANPDNKGELFAINPNDAHKAQLLIENAENLQQIEMLTAGKECADIIRKENAKDNNNAAVLPITSTVSLESEYPGQSSSLLSLIKNAEALIK